MRAARRPPEALAVVPASLHPLYTADDRCLWLLLHTLCAMHTTVLRESMSSMAVVPEDSCSRPWRRAARETTGRHPGVHEKEYSRERRRLAAAAYP